MKDLIERAGLNESVLTEQMIVKVKSKAIFRRRNKQKENHVCCFDSFVKGF